MMDMSDVRLLVSETAISLEAALATAEQIARHGIVESSSFDNLMTLLEDAASAVDQIRRMVQEVDHAAASGPTTPRCNHTALQLISGTSGLGQPTHAGRPPLRLASSQDG